MLGTVVRPFVLRWSWFIKHWQNISSPLWSLNSSHNILIILNHIFRRLLQTWHGQTYRQTDTSSYRDSYPHLKSVPPLLIVGDSEDARTKGRVSMWISIAGIIIAIVVLILVPVCLYFFVWSVANKSVDSFLKDLSKDFDKLQSPWALFHGSWFSGASGWTYQKAPVVCP